MSKLTERKGSILIVDDSEDIRALFGHILSAQYDVVEAENGKVALSLCEKQDFDVIILDENMPEMGGHECYAKLREKSYLTPVIFCTGMPSDDLHKRELHLGAFDYLSKPVDVPNLIQLVDDAYAAKQRISTKRQKQAQ